MSTALHIMLPTRWICSLTAASMALRITLKALVATVLAHDG